MYFFFFLLEHVEAEVLPWIPINKPETCKKHEISIFSERRFQLEKK